MLTPTILRPDSKGRIGLRAFTQRLERRFNIQSISGYEASLTEDGSILLRPKTEFDAETASVLLLADADRDAFMQALENPPSPNEKMRAAFARHHASVATE
jgi:hypothetical protein